MKPAEGPADKVTQDVRNDCRIRFRYETPLVPGSQELLSFFLSELVEVTVTVNVATFRLVQNNETTRHEQTGKAYYF